MPQDYKRKFKGIWIPREIWLDDKMSIVEKGLLAEIDSLDNEDGCTAGNSYFGRLFKISTRQVKRYISRIQGQGWITNEAIGRNRRRLRTTEKLEFLRDTYDPHEGHKCPSAEGHKCPSINTVYINTVTSAAAEAASGVEKKKKTDPNTPMTLRQFMGWCEKSTHRHIHIIGMFAGAKKVEFKTLGQWQSFIRRNLRPARNLAPFSDEQIRQAAEDIHGAQWLRKWTLETVEKFLVK